MINRVNLTSRSSWCGANLFIGFVGAVWMLSCCRGAVYMCTTCGWCATYTSGTSKLLPLPLLMVTMVFHMFWYFLLVFIGICSIYYRALLVAGQWLGYL